MDTHHWRTILVVVRLIADTNHDSLNRFGQQSLNHNLGDRQAKWWEPHWRSNHLSEATACPRDPATAL